MIDPDLVERLPPFQGMTHAEIREVLRCAGRCVYAPEEAVFHEGQEAGIFYLLLDGYIRVVRTAEDGNQVISLFIPPGELFGIAAALGRVSYPASAIAASEVAALAWPMRLWSRIAMRHAGFANATHRTIGGRFAEMNDRLMEMSTGQVQHRVARTLLRLAAQSSSGLGNPDPGNPGPDNPGLANPGANSPGADIRAPCNPDSGIANPGHCTEIAFPITRQQISEMSGTTLHTVSRLLSAWEKRGIVESRRKHVSIRDATELRALGAAT